MALKDHPQFAVIRPEVLQGFKDLCRNLLKVTAPTQPAISMLRKIIDTGGEETVASLQAAPWNLSAAEAQAISDALTAIKNVRTAIQAVKDVLDK